MDKFLVTLDMTLSDPSFWIGLVVVFIFARERFGQRQSGIDEELLLPIPMRTFTTRFRYNFAAFVYGGISSTTYVALVCLGAFPELQELIKTWFGAVGVGVDIGDHTIATPLGAAVVVTSVLPSIPFVRNLDGDLRATLRDFASIPLKAKFMAGLLIDRLEKEVESAGGGTAQTGHAAIDAKLALFEGLKSKVHDLQHLTRLRAARSYIAFFSKYLKIQDQIEKSVESIQKELRSAKASSEFLNEQIEDANERMAQFIVCGILAVEADEYCAMRTLTHDLNVRGIAPTTWRFKSSQILLGIVVVFLCAVLGSVVAGISMQYLSVDAPRDILELFIPICLAISLALVPTFVAPLVFAAGAEMYMIDRSSFRDEPEWDERLMAAIQTFLGCLGTALLITVVLGVLASHVSDNQVVLGPILPWAIPPAVVALTFFITSRIRVNWSRPTNAIVDFSLHAAVAVVAALLAQKLSLMAGLEYQGQAQLDLLIYAVTEPLPIAVVSGLIGGVLGMMQCAVSRDRPPATTPQASDAAQMAVSSGR